MKRKLQDEIAKAILMKNGAPLTISENEDLVSKIKLEVAQTLEVAHTLASALEMSEMVLEGMFCILVAIFISTLDFCICLSKQFSLKT